MLRVIFGPKWEKGIKDWRTLRNVEFYDNVVLMAYYKWDKMEDEVDRACRGEKRYAYYRVGD
jgi:hypothetical protein